MLDCNALQQIVSFDCCRCCHEGMVVGDSGLREVRDGISRYYVCCEGEKALKRDRRRNLVRGDDLFSSLTLIEEEKEC